MGNELVKMEASVVKADNEPMSIEKLVGRSMLIQRAMGAVMKDGEHYGKIPGCGEKPTLLKAGAEKLTTLFRLSPEFAVESIDLGSGHREYRVKCRMLAADGSFLGEGCGSASTTESKWRYRSEATSNLVPQAYWETRDPALLGGSTFTPRKITDKASGKTKWIICQRVEHSDPADYYNTCLKMAVKRAHVAAALTVTSASDIFSQDLDDLEHKAEEAEAIAQEEQKPQDQQLSRGRPRSKPTTTATQTTQQSEASHQAQGTVSPETKITEEMLVALIKETAKSNKNTEQLGEYLFGTYGIPAIKDTTYGIYGEVMNWVKNGKHANA